MHYFFLESIEQVFLTNYIYRLEYHRYILLLSTWNKGAFNNYVDQILTNFDPLPPLEWTSVDIFQLNHQKQQIDKAS